MYTATERSCLDVEFKSIQYLTVNHKFVLRLLLQFVGKYLFLNIFKAHGGHLRVAFYSSAHFFIITERRIIHVGIETQLLKP